MNKYLIQYSEWEYDDDSEESYFKVMSPVVRNFTDKQLEDFCKNKQKVNVTFLCKSE